MMFGLSLAQVIILHVAISLIGIGTGLWAMIAYARGRGFLPVSGGFFLVTTAATTITGFLFPFAGLTPAVITGLVSTLVLTVAFAARYVATGSGRAETAYAISATAALYLNIFVLVVQMFQKIPALNALAPTGTEPPFLVAQLLALAGHGFLGFVAWRRARGVNS